MTDNLQARYARLGYPHLRDTETETSQGMEEVVALATTPLHLLTF